MRITDADRAAAREDRQARPKMTERAKAALRERNEAERRNEAEEARVCAEFLKLRRDVPNFAHALQQIHGLSPHLDRMAQKLLASVESGLFPTPGNAVSDIVFLATLTPAEERMTDLQFEAELRKHAAMKHHGQQKPQKRQRASRKAKELVWGTSSPQISPAASDAKSIA